jgi:uncharacterized protein YchJ
MKIRTLNYHRHFAFAYVLLVAAIFCSCGSETQYKQPQEKQVTVNEENLADSRYDILILDSCEYIVFAWVPRDDHVITHKGNCKFCVERSKK